MGTICTNKYYIQRFARQALCQMPPVEGFMPPTHCLDNITAEDFIAGFNQFRQALRGVYERIIRETELLDLTPVDQESRQAAKKVEPKAIAAFRRISDILTAAANGVSEGDALRFADNKTSKKKLHKYVIIHSRNSLDNRDINIQSKILTLYIPLWRFTITVRHSGG